MKQHMNRITALFLCLAMVIGVLGMLPGAVATASAAQTSAAAGVAPNLLEDLNYSFENGTEDWTFSPAPFYQVVNDEAKVGSGSLKVDTDGTARLIMSNFVNVSDISNLFLSFHHKGTGVSNLFVSYYDDDLNQIGSNSFLKGVEATEQWAPVYSSSKVPDGVAYAKLYISRQVDGEVWYDNAIIRDADLKVYAPELRETFEGYTCFDDMKMNSWELRGNNSITADITAAQVDGRTVAHIAPTGTTGGLQSAYIDVSDYDTIRFSVDIKSTANVFMYGYLYDSGFKQIAETGAVSSGNGQKNGEWTVLYKELTNANAAYARVYIALAKDASADIDNVCIKGQPVALAETDPIDFESGGLAGMYADGWSLPINDIPTKGDGVAVAAHPETGSNALRLTTNGYSKNFYAYSPRIYIGNSTKVTVSFTSYGTDAGTCNIVFYDSLTSSSTWKQGVTLDTTGEGTQHTLTVDVLTDKTYPYIGLNFVKTANLTGTTYIDNIQITGNAQQGEDPGVQEEAPLFLHDFNTGSYFHTDPYKWANNGASEWSLAYLSIVDGAWKCPNTGTSQSDSFKAKSPSINLNGSEQVKLSARYKGSAYFLFSVRYYDEAGNIVTAETPFSRHFAGADWTESEHTLAVPAGAVTMQIFVQKDWRANGTDSYLDYIRVDHVHVTEKVDEVPATTAAPGTEAYYTCDCGKLFADAEATEQIKAPAVIPQLAFEISKKNINMGENLGLIFAVKRSDLTGTHTKYSAKATMPDGTTVIVPFTDWNGETIEGVDYKYFSVNGLAAKEMNDAVEAVILYNGEVVSPVSSLSVREYAEYQLANSDNAEFKTVCVDLLNYGAAAQTHFGYQTENLANSDIDEYQTLATGSVDLSAAKREITTDTTGSDRAIKTSVRFESDISLMVAIDGNISYATGKITFTNHNGNKVEKAVSFANSKTTNIGGKGYRYMEFTGMVIADLNEDITVTVDQKIVMTYNLAQYVKEAMENGSETMQDLAEAFGKVSTSAYAYKH